MTRRKKQTKPAPPADTGPTSSAALMRLAAIKRTREILRLILADEFSEPRLQQLLGRKRPDD